MTRARGCFVTGTDTGVGKTVVACAILRGLRAQGLSVGALKPVETGVDTAGPLDALALRDAAGGDDPLETVCPQRFAMPAAPTAAAAAEGRAVEIAALDAAFDALARRHDFVVVEGAGGLLVPVGVDPAARIPAELTMADLAARWALPVVVVARAALGTINHTRLTVGAALARGLEVRGIVISHAGGTLSDADAANLEVLRASPGVPILGEVPPLDPGVLPDPYALDLDPLLRDPV